MTSPQYQPIFLQLRSIQFLIGAVIDFLILVTVIAAYKVLNFFLYTSTYFYLLSPPSRWRLPF